MAGNYSKPYRPFRKKGSKATPLDNEETCKRAFLGTQKLIKASYKTLLSEVLEMVECDDDTKALFEELFKEQKESVLWDVQGLMKDLAKTKKYVVPPKKDDAPPAEATETAAAEHAESVNEAKQPVAKAAPAQQEAQA